MQLAKPSNPDLFVRFIFSPATHLLLILACVSFLSGGCKKEPGGNNIPIPGIPESNIPVSESINAGVSAYILNNSQDNNQIYTSINGQYLDYSGITRGFTINQTPLKTYQSKIRIEPGNLATWYDVFKTWPQTNSIRNYLDIKLFNYTDVGVIGDVKDDATFTLPENGEIHLPPYSLYNNTGSFPFYLAAAFIKPTDEDYALSLPCYPMADENNRRWSLSSYGTYLVLQKSHDQLYTKIDFQGTEVLLKCPFSRSS